MADLWRSRTPRGQRKDRRLGTIDGRLLEAAPVFHPDPTRRPNDEIHPVLFNSGGPVIESSVSPPYIVEQDGIIIGLKLTVSSGSVKANVFVNGTRRATISHS